MRIDAKDVGILFWKILRFSTNTVFTCVRKYPIVSGVSVVIFFLYTFLPFLFYLILYASPFIVCSVFYLRNHLSFKPSEITQTKTVNGLPPSSRKGRTMKVDLKHQRSVRRNARRKVEEVGKDWDSSQASEDERDKVILTTLYGEIPKTKKSPKLQNFKKEKAFLVSEEFSFEPYLNEETSSTTENIYVVDPSLTSGGGETEIECSSSSSEGEEEETTRENKKVVAWTEDDQKNLMDLGNSEMERNKRLEHLISRRKTRRLFLLAAEKSLMDMEVPSISVGRNYFGLDQENYIIDGLQTPESAPSVFLLPTRNPFDLPYDPQEEKPNLSGDSFQQEFTEANPNDTFFCHHESFCRRICPSEIQLDSKLEPWERKIDGWPIPQQGSNNRLVGENHPLTRGIDQIRPEGNEMESELMTEIVVSDSSSLLSPGEMEINSNVLNQVDTSEILGKRSCDHRVGNSLVGVIPRNTGSLSTSLAAERQKYMEHFGYSSRKGHKLTHSAESDLQVEVSETGSPPTTVDGNNSSESDEEKSLFVYKSDTGKETRFSDEENESKQKSIVDGSVEPQMLPVDQDFNETKQFEGLDDGTYVNVRSKEDERSKSRISNDTTVPHTNEVISKREEESQISYDCDEPDEPSKRRTDQEYEEHFERNDEIRTSQEMQEIVEGEASDAIHVTSDELATSPRSVLPNVSSPLDQTFTFTSENLELTSDSQPPEPESSESQLGSHNRNTRETEGQSVSNEEATEEDSTLDSFGSTVTSN